MANSTVVERVHPPAPRRRNIADPIVCGAYIFAGLRLKWVRQLNRSCFECSFRLPFGGNSSRPFGAHERQNHPVTELLSPPSTAHFRKILQSFHTSTCPHFFDTEFYTSQHVCTCAIRWFEGTLRREKKFREHGREKSDRKILLRGRFAGEEKEKEKKFTACDFALVYAAYCRLP